MSTIGPKTWALALHMSAFDPSGHQATAKEINPEGMLRPKDLAVLNGSRHSQFDVYVIKIGSAKGSCATYAPKGCYLDRGLLSAV
jgi:hypothetical protein